MCANCVVIGRSSGGAGRAPSLPGPVKIVMAVIGETTEIPILKVTHLDWDRTKHFPVNDPTDRQWMVLAATHLDWDGKQNTSPIMTLMTDNAWF